MKKTIHLQNIQNGFGMVEVLAAVLVLSIGLLGLAALQSNSLKSNQVAYQRSQVNFLAYDMIDRMRANRGMAIDGDYNIAFGGDLPAGADVAAADLGEWVNNIEALLPAGEGSINCVSPEDNVATCTVGIRWDESRLGGSATSQTVGDLTVFTFESQI